MKSDLTKIPCKLIIYLIGTNKELYETTPLYHPCGIYN